MPSTTRQADLDWIRVVAFGLLILYHVGMFYVLWDWHVKSPAASRVLEPLMLATNPWRLLLLFVVSGAATRLMAERWTAGALARSRAWRLGLPIVLAMLVVVPPQTYYEVVQKTGAALSPLDFYLRYITGSGDWCPGGKCIVTPTWNHMWFVVYLLVYTLVAALVLAVRPNAGKRFAARLDAMPAWAFLAVPALVFVVLRLALAPLFPATRALIDDWYSHAAFGFAFAIGFGLARAENLRERMIAWRWAALAIWLAACIAYVAYAWLHPRGIVAPDALRVAMRVVYGIQQWAAVFAVLAFAAKHLRRRGGPLLATLSEAVFPVYIVHQTIIVVLAFRLAPVGLPLPIEGLILVAAAFGGGWLVYEAARRFRPLRPWLGLKALQPPPDRPQVAA